PVRSASRGTAVGPCHLGPRPIRRSGPSVGGRHHRAHLPPHRSSGLSSPILPARFALAACPCRRCCMTSCWPASSSLDRPSDESGLQLSLSQDEDDERPRHH